MVGLLAGCGFIAAGAKSHLKPNTFVLIGHATIALPKDDHRAAGTACEAPAAITDLGPLTVVKVLDPAGHTIAVGSLDAGTIDRDGPAATCDFAFQIRGVPGGVTSYGVTIGDRAPQSFQAIDLRRNTPAVVTITQ